MFTIVTPTFNREDLVQRTIKSILDQTFADWELIVVDDGSTDNTEAVIHTYLADERIRYIKKGNSGQADSLNAGALLARGDFITFLDSDDEAYPNWLQVVHGRLENDTGIACVGAIRKLLNGSLVPEGMGEHRLFGETLRLKFTCGSLFIRKEVFRAVGGYDATLKSNIQTDLGYRLLSYLKGKQLKVVTIDEYLVQINIHKGERIRTNWRKTRDGGVQFIKKHYDLLYQNNRKEIANIYSSIAFSSYKLNCRVESVRYLFKAIRHNPVRWINYMRVLKYGFLPPFRKASK